MISKQNKPLQSQTPGSFSQLYRADCEKILPDPQFLQNLEKKISDVSLSDKASKTWFFSPLTRRKWQMLFSAAACLVVVFGAVWLLTGILRQDKMTTEEAQQENAQISSGSFSSAAAENTLDTSSSSFDMEESDSLGVSEDSFSETASQPLASGPSGNLSEESEKNNSSEEGQGNPNTGGGGGETEENGSLSSSSESASQKNSLQVRIQNSLTQENSAVIASSTLELLYTNLSLNPIQIDYDYMIQVRENGEEYHTLHINSLIQYPTRLFSWGREKPPHS